MRQGRYKTRQNRTVKDTGQETAKTESIKRKPMDTAGQPDMGFPYIPVCRLAVSGSFPVSKSCKKEVTHGKKVTACVAACRPDRP